MNLCRSNNFVIKSMLLGSIIGAAIFIWTRDKYKKEEEIIPSRYYNERGPVKDNMVSSMKRNKRFLIYSGSGVVKLVIGASFPIILADKKRSLNMFYNLQMQYSPPTIPVYWWSLYNTTTFAARKQRSIDMLLQHDNSRSRIYGFMETLLHSTGTPNTSECLLNLICEMTRAPLSEGATHIYLDHYSESEPEYAIADDYGRNIYHKLINVIFTPHLSNVDQRYHNAYRSGLGGSDCGELYGKCSIVDDIFKKFTRVM